MPNQSAVCWAAYSPASGTAYGIDAGLPRLGKVDPSTGEFGGYLQLDPATGGGYDTVAMDAFLYVLTKAPGVGVVDVSKNGGTQIQQLDLSSIGSRMRFTGMAVYSSGGRHRDRI